jgi:hypothetical protein
VRRVVGTAKNVLWRNDPVTIDVAKMPEDDLFFQFAKFAVQSQGCMDARQSIDLLLSPKYVHPESIGNYMMEYHVTLKLTNSGEAPRKVDFQYGKTDAPIGLAWQMIVAPEEKDLATLAQEPVTIGWAGMKRTEGEPYYKKTMLEEGPLTIEPGETEWVSTRLMVLGTSSLPWQLHVVPVE